MVANFPLWAFSRTFREKLQQREDYGWLAPRPWLPIGLRVRNESITWMFPHLQPSFVG